MRPFAPWVLLVMLAAGDARAAHAFDLASKMPPRLSLMWTLNWFGIKSNDPQPGVDGTYGQWRWTSTANGCSLLNDPSTCAAFPDAGLQRVVASRRRPLAGIYSSTGRTAESLRHIDLMLATLRAPCGERGGLDAYALQIDSIKFTSRYPTNQQAGTWDLTYRGTLAVLDRADALGLTNVASVSLDQTVYWHWGDAFGLTTQAQRIAAFTDDITDAATIAAAHPSALKVGGKPLLGFYADSQYLTAAEWTSMLDAARAASGVDFYAFVTSANTSYLGAFDAVGPWIDTSRWNNTTGTTLYQRALTWQAGKHAALLTALPSFPGRVVFGAVTPGFDDYTEDWGNCTERIIPRDPAVLDAQFDYFQTQRQSDPSRFKGLVLQTWNDWTEGSEFEPSTTEGASRLVQARQRFASLYGQSADPAGDAALASLWGNAGQRLNCCFAGGSCPDAGAAIEPRCTADAGTDGGQPDAGADAGTTDGGGSASDGGEPDADPTDGGLTSNAPPRASCGCDATVGSLALLAALGLPLLRRRRRRSSRRRASR